ncbi:MAG: hypothetical protein ABJH07_23360 [Sedimentitalea sp.]|uniref:hypothetical protein n=1 Tax=Sedimentitalea sp. TaxID=2048915 RepID=UPI00329986F9
MEEKPSQTVIFSSNSTLCQGRGGGVCGAVAFFDLLDSCYLCVTANLDVAQSLVTTVFSSDFSGRGDSEPPKERL